MARNCFDALKQVEFVYKRQCGRPQYADLVHSGQPPRYPSFTMHVPIAFLPWDQDRGGLICLMHPIHQSVITTSEQTCDKNINIGICRCGVVKYGLYFQQNRIRENGCYDIALKIMDKQQLRLQQDDIMNEVRVMAQLQAPGFTGMYQSPHFSQWECCHDIHNEYIATDWASNGSLILYTKHRLHQLKRFVIPLLIQTISNPREIETVLQTFITQAWIKEGLYIFNGIMRGLAYMHAQNVCHLDLDPCNIVMDRHDNPRIIDFGSSEIMDNNGYAGQNDRLIKFKPLYVAPEVRNHNHHDIPRPGFKGAAADMWSAGVLLYQLLCFGYPKGHLALIYDPNWRHNLMCHIQVGYGQCLGSQGCLICFRHIEFPLQVHEIFLQLLIPDRPCDRISAVEVVNILHSVVDQYERDFEKRCLAILEALLLQLQ